MSVYGLRFTNIVCRTHQQRCTVHENTSQRLTLEHQRSNTGTEWPYYWALGALFANQKSDAGWDGDYVTPPAMKYRDIPSFNRLVLTRGWACRFNEKLLKRGKIIQSSPTCFGAAKSGEGRNHPRWDLWSVSGDITENDVKMDPSKVEGESLYRESDCKIVYERYEKESHNRAWLTQLENIYDRSVGAFTISSRNEFLSAYVENLVAGQGRCESKLQIGPTYMNDRIENSEVRLYRNSVEISEAPGEERRRDIAGISIDNMEKMVLDANAEFREKTSQLLCNDQCSFVDDSIKDALGVNHPDTLFRLEDPKDEDGL